MQNGNFKFCLCITKLGTWCHLMQLLTHAEILIFANCDQYWKKSLPSPLKKSPRKQQQNPPENVICSKQSCLLAEVNYLQHFIQIKTTKLHE